MVRMTHFAVHWLGARGLLLNTLIFIETIERVGRKFASSVMANKLGRLVKLRLDFEDAVLDALLDFRLGPQAESLHAPTCFINDEQQIIAATYRSFLHWAAGIEVQQLERIVMTLVAVAGKSFLDHFSLLAFAAHTGSTRVSWCFCVLD